MHSLKNTIVAVGLLGLSFLFYQASTKPNPNAHLSDEVPELSISDGTDGFKKLAAGALDSGMDTIKSKLGSLPDIEMPDLSQPKQMISDLSNNFANNINDKATQLKQKVNNGLSELQLNTPESSFPSVDPPQLEMPTMNVPQLDAPQLDASTLDMPTLETPKPLQFNAPLGSSTQSLSPPPIRHANAELQPLNNSARDQGLIAALKSQAQLNQKSASPSNNDFQSDKNASAFQPDQVPSEFQFASQPIPDGDSSFNRLATDSRDADSDSNVFQANVESEPALNFEAAWSKVDQLVKAEDFVEALTLLSKYYRRNDISGPQRQRLNGWLDALAGKVIFSTEHHLDQPFTVANESLTDISGRWRVPAQLIYNINKSKIANPAFVDSGTELKVVRGPFNCEIDMSNNVMTLFLGDLYAGRYPVKMGISGNPKPGEYRVLAKSIVGHSWRDAAGNEYPPESPQNGYGPNWIGLSGSLCIHSVDETVTGTHTGCIGLNPKDSKDVFGILSKTSAVTIMR